MSQPVSGVAAACPAEVTVAYDWSVRPSRAWAVERVMVPSGAAEAPFATAASKSARLYAMPPARAGVAQSKVSASTYPSALARASSRPASRKATAARPVLLELAPSVVAPPPTPPSEPCRDSR